MGILTRDEMADEISKNLGGRADDDDPTRVRIFRHLNLAQRRIARAPGVRWRELKGADTSLAITPVGVPATDAFVDVAALVLAANTHELRRIHSLRILDSLSTDHKLIRRLPRQWDRLYPDSRSWAIGGSTREIVEYVQWNTKIQLYRIPSVPYTLNVRYTRFATAFSTAAAPSSQVSDLADKDDMIIALTTHNLLQSLGQGDDAKIWFAMYNNLLNDAKMDTESEPDEGRFADGISEASTPQIGDYWNNPFTSGDY